VFTGRCLLHSSTCCRYSYFWIKTEDRSRFDGLTINSNGFKTTEIFPCDRVGFNLVLQSQLWPPQNGLYFQILHKPLLYVGKRMEANGHGMEISEILKHYACRLHWQIL
jgi:hypothetical protein